MTRESMNGEVGCGELHCQEKLFHIIIIIIIIIIIVIILTIIILVSFMTTNNPRHLFFPARQLHPFYSISF